MSPEVSILPLRERGQLVFPIAFDDWRSEAHENPPTDLAGPSLTWRRQAGGPSVRVIALDSEPASSDAVLIAHARTVIDGADAAWAEASLRLDAIPFADDLRLARWFSHASAEAPGSLTLFLALHGRACEVVMIASGQETEDLAFADLRAVAAQGRFEARPSAPPRT